MQGIFLPVATPFDSNGGLYPAKLRHNLEKWSRTGISGYVVGGPVGESAALTGEEKLELLSLAAAGAAASGKLLIAAAMELAVREAAKLAGHAASLGYQALLVAAPSCYCDPAVRELYFRAAADQCCLPVIVSRQPVDVTARLARHPNIVAAVAASDDGIPALKPHLAVLTASETELWACLSAGAAGAAPAVANAAPYAAITIWEAHRARHAEAGLDWQNRIAQGAAAAGKYGIPGLKHAMDLNGYYGGPCRLPLAPLPPAAKREIESAFRDLKG
ncbi:MAG: dihydrodipicolinate synthase family protein [Bryobacterales bacterium]|nr:dihydrodipicolinate synthase family protein [Bryobacterales bacterium]